MNEIDQKLKELVRKVASFDKFYEQIRIVDPVKKRILIYEKGHLMETQEVCHDFWCQNKPCTNCISMRAYNENSSFIKIEYTPDKIFMVTAIPVELDGRKGVVELLKDITKSMVLEDENNENNTQVKNFLNKTNTAAMTDALTEIYNKRYILERLPNEIFSHHLKEESISLIMADIDFFKRVNDTYGHLAGDFILKEFAKILKNNIRENNDWVARFGGEEFLICLPNTKKDTAIAIAERIRKSIEKEIFTYKDQDIQITSSFGICTLTDEQTSDYEEFIHCADQNLYKAKQNGRNRVVG